MQTVELLVNLKIPDVTAQTAAIALRRRMGYGAVLKGLQRCDYYALTLDAEDEGDALALARELAERTNLFVNPNKHAFTVRLPGQQTNPRLEGELWVAEALVADAVAGSAGSILAALQGRLGYGQTVIDVRRGVLWTLRLACDSSEEARRVAETVVVTRSRDQGLLMNPHFQTWWVI